MDNYQSILNSIIKNNAGMVKDEVRKILVLYVEKVIYIGDFCLRVDKLHYVKSYFANAAIYVNFINTESEGIFNSLLANNPYVNAVTTLKLLDVDFTAFDIIFCVSYDEEVILKYIHLKYNDLIVNDQFRPSVFSMSGMFLAAHNGLSNYLFPAHGELYKFIGNRPGELCIAAAERQWADEWLELNGIKKGEQLFVIIDSTSQREKLLDINVYFEYLTHVLNKPGVKVLNFDVEGEGKDEFYAEWLAPEQFDKMIFAKGFSLRQAICILASSYTRLIFGACTGLMHCASGIYNYFLARGMNRMDIPVMIVYTGQYMKGTSAFTWWGNSPLMNCLLLKLENNETKMLVLGSLSDPQAMCENPLPCSEYTSSMLINYTESMLLV